MDQASLKPWLRIWTHPRETIRSIIRKDPKYRFIILSAIYGFPSLLAIMQSFSMGESMPVVAILVLSLILAPFVGMLEITIMSWLLHWTGKWINGKAPFINIRAVVCWANVPNIPIIILWILLTAVFGEGVFYNGFRMVPFTGGALGFVTTVYFLKLVFAIWGLVILIIGLSETQKFSAWRAFFNVVIPFVIVTVLIWAVSMMFTGSI